MKELSGRDTHICDVGGDVDANVNFPASLCIVQREKNKHIMRLREGHGFPHYGLTCRQPSRKKELHGLIKYIAKKGPVAEVCFLEPDML